MDIKPLFFTAVLFLILSMGLQFWATNYKAEFERNQAEQTSVTP